MEELPPVAFVVRAGYTAVELAVVLNSPMFTWWFIRARHHVD